MNNILSALLFLFIIGMIGSSCSSNTEETISIEEVLIPEEEIIERPDEFPYFGSCADKKCSDEKLIAYLADHLTYPEEAKDAGIEEKVYVGFVVDTEGKMKNIKLMKDAKELFVEEAMRVVKSMNDDISWRPGTVDGKNVSVSYVLPITFKI